MTVLHDASLANEPASPIAPQGVFGTLYSWTLVQEAPEGFITQAPYRLALIKLEDGSMITAQLTDIDGELQIGDKVEMVTRKLTTDGERGMIVYGYKFRPVIT